MLLRRSLLQTLNIHVWWETGSALTSLLAANKSLMYGGKVFARQPPGKYLRFLCQRNISKLLFYIYSLNSSLSCQTHNYFPINTWCVSWAHRSCLFNLYHSAEEGLSEVTLWCLSYWQIRAHVLVQRQSKAVATIPKVADLPPLFISAGYSWTDSFPAAAARFNSEAVKHFQLPINTFDENKLEARNITDGKHNSRQWNHIRANAGCHGK